ncbi:16S rRNA (cytosine(967)-C(5))-methyltransferase RsmB [Snodgrassella sp. CFCC 13594]|uniref:16S rRNA (cytosine(967)-C(5))-methyltransferase RsmB n=1 Tax=Snodgrassella sp. CFCC 13594 TaxID=1775559 RepID=UPI0008352B73|nr:16S rRNA (cytosine(967)-C(5))-methyltransferase RsmB [Snodgrassella sp. CFCC 13594]
MSMATAQYWATTCVGAVLRGRNLTDVFNELWATHPELSATERGALQDMTYGCLRYYGLLQQLLNDMVSTPPAEIRELLLVALYQLQFTRNAVHAVVNETVDRAAKIAGGRFKNLVNAVLRRFLRERVHLIQAAQKHTQARFNLPHWWLMCLQQQHPKHWQNIAAASVMHPPMTLRINRRHHTAQSYLGLLHAAGMDGKVMTDYALVLTEPISVQKLPGFNEGWVSVQDFGAQQAIPLLNPQKGERILDACAAPGGKTGHILEWADCQVTALDIEPTRLQRVKANLHRLNFHAQLFCAPAEDIHSWYDGQAFDAILADVPCTASGVIKRHPDIKWLRRPQDALQTAAQQHSLLDTLWTTLKPKGRMLLATCSLFAEENQQQMQAFLQRHDDAHVREHHVLLPNGTQDGFFYALIDKI